MTFCVAIKTKSGVVALADTQITSGSERRNKVKLTSIKGVSGTAFIMTSGLRSVRDKTVTYLNEEIESAEETPTKMYKLVDLFCEKLRLVKEQDEASLKSSNLKFNLHTTIGGKLADDVDSQLFYIYPEGNWIESAADSPYFTSGQTSYGKPILDRLLTYETDLESALSLAYLAFDATRASVIDVDFPIDVLTCSKSGVTTSKRFESHELLEVRQSWTNKLADALETLPKAWLGSILGSEADQSRHEGQVLTSD